MDDRQIIDLYYAREEAAISETADKYGKYCYSIAYRILCDEQDSEECVNDTYWRAWEAIPPHCPDKLAVFLGKITRNLALNRFAYYTREKRGYGKMELVLEELQGCLPALQSMEQVIEEKWLLERLNQFLYDLPKEKRILFVKRYWYLQSIQEIAEELSMSESKVKMTLLRVRNKLKKVLEKEGFM